MKPHCRAWAPPFPPHSLVYPALSCLASLICRPVRRRPDSFTNLEDWLSTVTDINFEDLDNSYGEALGNGDNEQLVAVLEQLSRKIDQAGEDAKTGSGRNATSAMANLAEGIQGLVQHLRSEQQLMREWADQQASQQEEVKDVLVKLNDVLSKASSNRQN